MEINKAHPFSETVHGFQISPYMQELFVHAGASDVYGHCEEVLHTFLRIPVSGMQVYRVTDCYGELLEEQKSGTQSSEQKEERLPLRADEVLYAQVDGTMTLTRTDGWKEAKQGRLFCESDCLHTSAERGWMKHSHYEAYLGESKEFIRRFEPRLEAYGNLKERLVFITDGAPWISNWIADAYPEAIHILDWYHAVQYVSQFAQSCFVDKHQREEWLEGQKNLLWDSGVERVIEHIEGLSSLSEGAEESRKEVLRYYKTNKGRMDYQRYRSIGAGLIGSGAIEAAHRSVIHKRMKLSGQRWTIPGAQHLLNLRCVKMSGHWDKVVQLITNPPAKAA